MEKKTKKTETKVEKELVGTGKEKLINPRGRIFEGKVIRKFDKRIAIQFERMVYIKKYERYARYKTKIHARLPLNLRQEINVGDLVRVQECRPLSKIIHFIVIKKIKSGEEK
jgi:small subunit ribosomal protein S17